jgi:hypothetical protein
MKKREIVKEASREEKFGSFFFSLSIPILFQNVTFFTFSSRLRRDEKVVKARRAFVRFNDSTHQK